MLVNTKAINFLVPLVLVLTVVVQPVFNVNARQAYQNRNQRNIGPLTGTWRLDVSRSDNVDAVVERAIRRLPANEQQRARERVTRRLDAPDTIAIEQRGRRFTIASTRATQTTFDADGRTRTEATERGRTVRINVALKGDQLVVNRTGSQGNDFNVTFVPIERGRRMRITRSIYAERFPRPIIVTSLYERTSDIAQLNVYSGSPDRPGIARQDRGRFIVPNNTRLTAVLNTDLSTKEVNAGNRFSMYVQSPSQYRGAEIEGVVSNIESSGRVTGRAEMTLNFERIRLRDGSTYEFGGDIESIRTPDGKDVRIENEGTVKEDDSQSTRTITRTGVGAAIGAVIGAIAGGGSGAAIGAAVGAGTGAGSVLIQGRDNLDLPSGTEVTIRASSPRNIEARR
jgi:outer membrane lipoprotein SlyB